MTGGGGGVWKTILCQLNTADQSVWADSRTSTSILYGPDFLPTPTDQLSSIGADPPSYHTLYINLLLYGINSCCFISLLKLVKQSHQSSKRSDIFCTVFCDFCDTFLCFSGFCFNFVQQPCTSTSG